MTAKVGTLDHGPWIAPAGTDQALTIDDTAGGVSLSAFPAGTDLVLLTLGTAEVRYTIDGSAPTTTNGHLLSAYDERVWHVNMASVAKFIRTGATSGVLHASPLKIIE